MTPNQILEVGEEPPPIEEPTRPGRRRPENPRPFKRENGKGKPGSRFSQLNTFIDFTMGTLRPGERAVWFILFRDTKQNGIARTSEKDLARRAGISDRMVRYALKALENRGLVVVVKRGRLGIGPSSYRVTGLDRP